MHQTNIPHCTILSQKNAHICTFLLQNDVIGLKYFRRYWPFVWGSIGHRVIHWSMSASRRIGLGWMQQNTYGDTSTLVQVMVWCRRLKSHFLRQWGPIPVPPYGVIRPQSLKHQHFSQACVCYNDQMSAKASQINGQLSVSKACPG